jgi:hypothetical protein
VAPYLRGAMTQWIKLLAALVAVTVLVFTSLPPALYA